VAIERSSAPTDRPAQEFAAHESQMRNEQIPGQADAEEAKKEGPRGAALSLHDSYLNAALKESQLLNEGASILSVFSLA
jgi:hypothetical protein